MNARKQLTGNMRKIQRQEGGFLCTSCGHTTAVLDSRPVVIGGVSTLRRRRGCPKCFQRFTTYELIGRENVHAMLPALEGALKNAYKLMQELSALVAAASVLMRD